MPSSLSDHLVRVGEVLVNPAWIRLIAAEPEPTLEFSDGKSLAIEAEVARKLLDRYRSPLLPTTPPPDPDSALGDRPRRIPPAPDLEAHPPLQTRPVEIRTGGLFSWLARWMNCT